MKHKVSAIICCAGKGERAGFSKNKLLCPLNNAPALYHTLKVFDCEEISEVIVACSKVDHKEMTALCKPFGYKIVLGGDTRTETVYNALSYVSGDIVLICDGARPYTTLKIIKDCIETTIRYGSGICSTPVTDTIVLAEDNGVVAVPQRNWLYAVQTPQGFYTEDIKKAYDCAKEDAKTFTDDASVYLEYVGTPVLFKGDENNKKLTYSKDFASADTPTINCCGATRIGFGVDVHSFGKEQDFVILCGEKISCDSGLVAHSDGDVCVHALMDALLSACGLNDIGHYFPDTDEKWKNADSMKMLESVVALITEKGFAVMNAVINIQAEKPRLAKHIDAMKENIANALKVSKDNVSICAGTSEKLGFVGEGKGIYCTSTVLLKSL